MALMAAKIVFRTITAEEIFRLIDRHGVTHFGGAPIVLGMLVNAPDKQRPDLSDRTVRAMTWRPATSQYFGKTLSYGV